MDFKKEIFLITGASSGLGEQLALFAGSKQSTVIMVGRNKDKLEQVKENILKAGGNAHYLICDLSDLNSIPVLINSIKELKIGTPTVLINNAGYNAAGFVLNTPLSVYEKNFKTNFFAPLSLIQHLTPDMIKQNKGVIINIMSAAMYHSFPGISSYCCSKKALGALHESLQTELSDFPIQTIYVNPGSFKSGYFKNTLVDGRLNNYKYQSKREHLRKDPKIVAKRIFKAIEEGKNHLDLSSFMDKIGYHINYWLPKFLDKLLIDKNQEVIKNHPKY